MQAQQPDPQLALFAKGLRDFRDALVLISLFLKDQLAETTSPEGDALALQVAQQLAHIGTLERGAFD